MNAPATIIRPGTPGLLTPSAAYKPFRYPWAFDMWKKQQQVHWMPEEVPLGEDVKDWASTLNDGERNLLTQIFRFFTQADIEVQDNYMERYGRVFKPTEVKMMLAAFGNMETIHIAAYALLLETIGMPESEFGAFMEYEAMRDKHDYMGQFGVDSDADICRTLAMFGGFSEGVQLFASFAMLMNFPRQNKMKGMGQIVSWSVRDESLHCEGIIKLYHAFNKETGAVTKSVADDIVDCCKTVVTMEDKFIDLAFEMGDIEGLTAAEVKQYIRFIADRRLVQLGLKPNWDIEKNPLPWMEWLLSAADRTKFFENKVANYEVAGLVGEWDYSESRRFKVFSKEGCPFCVKAKAELRRLGHEFSVIDLSDDAKRQEFYDEHGFEGGDRTMPKIWEVDEAGSEFAYVGGFDDLRSYLGGSGKPQAA